MTLARVLQQGGRDGDKRTIAFQEVDNPAAEGTRQVAAVSMRRGGVDEMHERGSISDAQHDAHLRFRNNYEVVHANGVQAFDYNCIRVDGGGGGDGNLDRVIRARDRLAAIRNNIGQAHFDVLVLMSGIGFSLEEARQRLPANDNGSLKKKSTVSKLLKAALDRLDVFWNDPGARQARVRSEAYGERATMARWSEKAAG